MLEFTSNSPIETEKFAKDFAKKLQGGEVIAFRGGLGMGKTCFVRGLSKGLGFSGETYSPTFALMNEYIGGRLSVYHFDMYRIDGWDDLYSTGFFDYRDSGGVLAVEWSENIEGALENDTVYVTFERTGDSTRTIIISREEA